MKRYKNIGLFNPLTTSTQRRYTTTKYPEISRSFEDIYVYTAMGDRYDILALSYYSDSTLWWIISSANPEYGNRFINTTSGNSIKNSCPKSNC
jgi:hypothetical protein